MKAETILEIAYLVEKMELAEKHKKEFESLKDTLVDMELPEEEIFNAGGGEAEVAGVIISRDGEKLYALVENPIWHYKVQVKSLSDIYVVHWANKRAKEGHVPYQDWKKHGKSSRYGIFGRNVDAIKSFLGIQ